MSRFVTVLLVVFLVTGALGALGAYLWMKDAANDSSASSAPKPASRDIQQFSMKDLFREDFPTLLRSYRGRRISVEENGIKATIELTEQLYSDFLAKSKFVGFYIPSSKDTYDLCLYLADHADFPFDLGKNIASGGIVGEQTASSELTFSGRVYIYHEDRLSLEQQAEIARGFSQRGLTVTLRGPNYLALQLIARNADRD